MIGDYWGEVQYFRYVEHLLLNKDTYSLPYDIVLICYSKMGVEDPKSEPVGVVTQSGINRILWRKLIWSICDVPYHQVEKKLCYSELESRTKQLPNQYEVYHASKVRQLLQIARSSYATFTADEFSDGLSVRAVYPVNKL